MTPAGDVRPVGEIHAGWASRTAWLATGTILALGYVRETAAALQGIPSHEFGYADFGLDAEGCIPAWYSSALMLLCALLMLLLRFDTSTTGRRDAAGWTGLGCIFILLSMDESISVHEQWVAPLRAMLSATGVFYFAWVVAGLFVVAVLALIYLPFVMRLQRAVSRRLLLAAAIFVSGAIGMEMLCGWVVDTYGRPPFYSLAMGLEETLEMTGVTLLFSIMLNYATQRVPSFRLTSDQPPPAPRHRRAAAGRAAGRGS